MVILKIIFLTYINDRNNGIEGNIFNAMKIKLTDKKLFLRRNI